MSRTKRSGGSSSPIKKHLSFKGSNGQVSYYDKNTEEKVFLESLDIVILDIKSSISGYNEKTSSGINSNMLDPYSVGKEEFVVKSKVNGSYGVVAQGIYKDIKDEINNMGGKFTTNIIALADVGDGDGMQIVKLELNGSGLTPWIEFTNDNDNDAIYDMVITISKGQLCKREKGKTVDVSKKEYDKVLAALKKDPMAQKPVWFYTPKFTFVEITEDLVEMANDNDTKLQEYFGTAPERSDDKPQADAPYDAEADEKDDLPF